MSRRKHLAPVLGGAIVGMLLVAVMLVGVLYHFDDGAIESVGVGILLATFALGTYAKIYRIEWREVLFILVANSLAMAARVQFGIPHGVLEVYGWVIVQIYVLFFWAALRKLKKKDGADSRRTTIPDSGSSSET